MSSSSTARHVIASRACDFCRQKKIKCKPLSGTSSLTWIDTSSQAACQACHTSRSSCTFQLPVKKRGPARKTRQTSVSDTSASYQTSPDNATSPTLSSLGGPQSLDHQRLVNTTSEPYADAFSSRIILNDLPANMLLNGPNSSFPTDSIFPRVTFFGLIQSYLDLIYPTVPIIHRPTFINRLRGDDLFRDDLFLSLLVSICAAVVAIIPRKFEEYMQSAEGLVYGTRTEMVEACCKFILHLRPVNYFDDPVMPKWAISYMIQIAYFQLGSQNRVAFWNAEAGQFARLLELEDSRTFQGLNPIEVQLRKKAFWLMFFPFVHDHLGILNVRLLRLYDTHRIESICVEDLWPLELDDEYITEQMVLPQPNDCLSLTTGFNCNARLFWISCTQRVDGSANRTLAPPSSGNFDFTSMAMSLNTRIEDLQSVIQEIDPRLSQWSIGNRGELDLSSTSDVEFAQFESIRANIHVTRLWLQSTMFESLEALQRKGNPQGQPIQPDTDLWKQREEVCQQLLFVLHNIGQHSLEPNGNSLTSKIRGVAATLLNCPFEQQGTIARRATNYINAFVDILVRLDITEHNRNFLLDSQVWSDLSTLSGKAQQERSPG